MAITQGINALQECARHLLEGDSSQADYWLEELLAEVTGYNAAARSILIVANNSGQKRLASLLLSAEFEVHAVVEAAIKLAEQAPIPLESPPRLDKVRAAQHLRTHLKRLDVKFEYIIHHLSEFFGNIDLVRMGDEFSATRSMLTGRFHTMSDGG